MKKVNKKIRIAVRDFAQPLIKTGSLGWEQSGGVSLEVGQELHQIIQERLKLEFPGYEAEYQIQHQMECDGLTLLVSGRCDGRFPAGLDNGCLFPEEDGQAVILEEIKTSYQLAALKKQLLAKPDHPYWLQLKTYLHFCRQNSEQKFIGRLRLVCSRSRQEELLALQDDHEEDFAEWCRQRCQQIVKEYEHFQQLKAERQQIFDQLQFPYASSRSSQQELIRFIRKNLKQSKQLMIQAPTGLGKTAGVLYPALRRAMKRGAPVFYLTPKNSQFLAALQFVQACHEKGIGIKALVISARTKACLNTEVKCQAEHCSFAKDYFDKLAARPELEQRDSQNHSWTLSYFTDLGRLHQICPYELSMSRLREADLIICDYNYVISIRGGLVERYLHPYLNLPKPVLVIDEAHNLYVRAMENYSPLISRSLFTDLRANEIARVEARAEVLALVDQGLQLFEKAMPKTGLKQNPYLPLLEDLLERTHSLLVEVLAAGEDLPFEDPLFLIYSSLNDMLLLSSIGAETMRCLEQYNENHKFIGLRLLCLDPSPILQPLFQSFDRLIAFSATLKPFDFYCNMSGFDPNECLTAEFPSPFPREHKKILMIPQVATSYRERQQHFPRIAEVIKRIVPLAKGHYFAFFPSYSFMMAVAELIQDSLPDWEIYRQESALNPSEIDQLMSRLRPDKPPCLVLAVQGGSLAEGMDFRGCGVRGVFVIGPGLPGFSPERKLMEEYYQQHYGRGRDYTYTYPAMARSVQAAGRVVRDYEERGLVVMMDRRFLLKEYAAAMPGDWYQDSPHELVSRQILRDIEDFWSEQH